jgi:catechol-2,3-dioxygenase
MAFRLNHVHLKSHDPQQAAKFYVENLGARSCTCSLRLIR